MINPLFRHLYSDYVFLEIIGLACFGLHISCGHKFLVNIWYLFRVVIVRERLVYSN